LVIHLKHYSIIVFPLFARIFKKIIQVNFTKAPLFDSSMHWVLCDKKHK
jgi:hypothetical protein